MAKPSIPASSTPRRDRLKALLIRAAPAVPIVVGLAALAVSGPKLPKYSGD
jgi:hypothetical protein